MNTMLVDLLKGTSLLVVIGAGELMTQGSIIRSRTFRALEVFTVIGALYFALCYPLSQSLLWFERRIAAGRPITIGRRRRLAAARIALPEPPDDQADDGEPESLEAVGS
jgi:hypothetical protein